MRRKSYNGEKLEIIFPPSPCLSYEELIEEFRNVLRDSEFMDELVGRGKEIINSFKS